MAAGVSDVCGDVCGVVAGAPLVCLRPMDHDGPHHTASWASWEPDADQPQAGPVDAGATNLPLPVVLVELAERAIRERFHCSPYGAYTLLNWGHVPEELGQCGACREPVEVMLRALFHPDRHTYWSTACLHAWMLGLPLDDPLHGYCACDVGKLGVKKPHTCKHGDCECICECHRVEVSRG